MSSLDTPFSARLEAREEEMKIKKITSSNNRRLLKSSPPANHQTDAVQAKPSQKYRTVLLPCQ